MSFEINSLPVFTDNYIYIVSDSDLGLAMVIDPGDAIVVRKFLEERDLHLSLILTTHHHKDHIGGSSLLAQDYGAPIIGPAKERGRIGSLSRGVVDKDVVTFSTLRGSVIETHGHTAGHISFYFPMIKALFCGDTLFSLGCGRLFEGTASEMWSSLLKLRQLPDDTRMYCGHEYTEANARFALAVDPDNVKLKARMAEVMVLRQKGLSTLPALMGDEKLTNPFLRVDQTDLQKALSKKGLASHGTDAAAVFGGLRAAKDKYNATS